MKTLKNFNNLMSYSINKLSCSEMYAVRGGTSGGGKIPMDEDILLPDPEPGDNNE